ANVPGGTLVLRQYPKTNHAVMRAAGGATLFVESVGVTNNGEIRAEGAGSVASYANSTITGGLLTATAGGLGVISGGTFANVTLAGPHQLNAGTVLSMEGTGITNNGVLTINATATNQGTYLRTDVSSATIGGAGTVMLNANPANLDSAQMNTANGGYVMTIGPGQTVAGSGAIRITTTMQGTLSPGADAGAIGRIEQRQYNVTLAPIATFEVDLNGLAAGEFDTFGANGAVALDGTLRVHVAAGFAPQLGDEFVILTAGSRSGTFEQIVTPNPGPNNAWRVRYEPTRAVLTVTCPPDIDGDHAVSLQDLAQLLAHFGAQSGAAGEDGDMDGDTDVDLQDLASLLATFGTTCP
ncbi:MAG: hypothetical protein HZB38_00325, partial [Planctomycetes bacterium]|nr:hypothetical protein [Planctomycetota bacterium]